MDSDYSSVWGIHGNKVSWLMVLDVLASASRSMLSKEVAEGCGFSDSNRVFTQLSSLYKKGFADKVALSPRYSTWTITEKGRKTIKEAYTEYGQPLKKENL